MKMYAVKLLMSFLVLGFASSEIKVATRRVTVDGVGVKTMIVPKTTGCGGQDYIVINRRVDATVNFVDRDWNDYKNGFGDLFGNFWLGNENMYYLTNSGTKWTLRVDMTLFNGTQYYAEYKDFKIGPESNKYRLSIGTYSGNAGDDLRNHNNSNFTTKDGDNDEYSGNCAERYAGGWWYYSCMDSKLTGRYVGSPGIIGSQQGIHWYTVSTYAVSMAYAEMRIRVQE